MKKAKSVHRQPRGRGEGDDRLGHQIMFKGLLRTLRKCQSKMLFEYFALSLNFPLHFGMVRSVKSYHFCYICTSELTYCCWLIIVFEGVLRDIRKNSIEGDCSSDQFSWNRISFLRKVGNDSEENASSSGIEIDDSEDDSSPLFFQPGKIGFYSPRQGKGSDERLNCFRNVGRCCIAGIFHLNLI